MVLLPYKEVLAWSKDKIKEALVPIHAAQAKQQGQLESLKINEKIVSLEAEIQELQMQHPFPWDSFIDKMDALALLERRKGKFEQYIGQLFPEEE